MTLTRLLLAGLLLVTPAAANEPAFAPGQREALEALIRDYILKNPDIVVEALQAYDNRLKAQEADALRQMIVQERDALLRDPLSYVGGNKAGDVTVVQFFDYRCGFCKRAKPELEAAVKTDGKVRVVFKELPVLGPDSVIAARVAIATLLHQPARYEALHDALMESRGALSEEAVFQIAAEAGVKVPQLRPRMGDPRIDQILAANRKLAERLGVQGTPAFVIGERILPGAGPAPRFLQMIADARADQARAAN